MARLINETALYHHLNKSYTSYPGNNHDQQVGLALLSDNRAALTFNATVLVVYNAFALTETIFDPDRFQISLNCVYPLSGQYDTLSRVLFYVLLVFSLIFRRHVWISVAALGTAMTYGAVSAIHLFTLVGAFDFRDPGNWNRESSKAFADVDFFGIFPVLTASGIMLTPILMWSTSVRKHHAQAVIVYWGVLIFAALATSLAFWVRGDGFAQNSVPSFASCARTPECLDDTVNLSREYYDRCECFDFCGTLGPTAPMRAGANMVPFLVTKTTFTVISDSFGVLFGINLLVLIFITINGFIGVLESYFSQSEVRNALFRFVNSDMRLVIKVLFEGQREHDLLAKYGLENPDMQPSAWKSTRYYIAKSTAAFFYLSAIFFTLVCPAVFISTVVANEIFLQALPPSEHSDAVGAWGAWVGAVLVLFAAVVERYSGKWMKALLVILEASWRVIKYARDDRPSVYSDNKEWSIREIIKDFFSEIASPFIHGWYSTARAFWTGKTNLKLFIVWWKNTLHESQMRGADLARVWEAEETKLSGGKPRCRCRMCERDRIEEKFNSQSEAAKEPSMKAALERVRKRVINRAGNEYQSVSNTPGASIMSTEMSKMQPTSVGTMPSSTPIFGTGEPESEAYDLPITQLDQLVGGQMWTPAAQSSPPLIPQPETQRPEVPRTETAPDASLAMFPLHQVVPPESAPERRTAFARRDTDQSIESGSGQEQSQGSRPRRKPVASYIAPEGDEIRLGQQMTSPDKAHRRDRTDGGT